MTKKNESEETTPEVRPTNVQPLTDRQILLARVAGDVASGIVVAPSKKATTAEAIAEIAVDIAEEIVKRACGEAGL